MEDVLDAQDGLYTLVLRHPDGTWDVTRHRVDRRLPLRPRRSRGGDRDCSPRRATRIVSLTITEGGYQIDESPRTRSASSAWSPTRWLASAPRARGLPSPTIVSCDNIEGNGDVARKTFTGVRRVEGIPNWPAWMAEDTRFPNSMVDRITPVTTPDVIEALASRVRHRRPVARRRRAVHVVGARGRLPDGRPAFEDVGVQVVDDVTPYELMKLRLLNASHQAPLLLRATCPDTGWCTTSRGTHSSPTSCCAVHGRGGHAHPGAGARDRSRRLQAHAHRTVRQPRGPRHRRPTVRRLVRPHPEVAAAGDPRKPATTGAPIRLSAAIVASWARYAEGVDEQGEPIDVRRPVGGLARPDRAKSQHENPLAFIENTAVFGDLAQHAALRRGVPVGAGLAAPRRCTGDPRSSGRERESARSGHRRGAHRHRRARRTASPASTSAAARSTSRSAWAGSAAPSTSSPTSATTTRGGAIVDYVEASGCSLVSGSITAAANADGARHLDAAGCAPTYEFDIEWQLSGTAGGRPTARRAHRVHRRVPRSGLPGHRGPARRLPLVGDDHLRPQRATGAHHRPRPGDERIERLVEKADVVKASDEDLRWIDPDRSPEQIAATWLTSGRRSSR